MKKIINILSKFCLKHYRCVHYAKETYDCINIPDKLRDFYSIHNYRVGEYIYTGSYQFEITSVRYNLDDDIVFLYVDKRWVGDVDVYFFCSSDYIKHQFKRLNRPVTPDESYDVYEELYKKLKSYNLIAIDDYEKIFPFLKKLLQG